jgi:hypothetical protein
VRQWARHLGAVQTGEQARRRGWSVAVSSFGPCHRGLRQTADASAVQDEGHSDASCPASCQELDRGCRWAMVHGFRWGAAVERVPLDAQWPRPAQQRRGDFQLVANRGVLEAAFRDALLPHQREPGWELVPGESERADLAVRQPEQADRAAQRQHLDAVVPTEAQSPRLTARS